MARVGLCQNAEMDLFPAMWKAYKSKDADADLADTEWGKSPTGAAWLAKCDKTNIKAVGVFDTVSRAWSFLDGIGHAINSRKGWLTRIA